MSVNLLPQTQAINEWLTNATNQLIKVGIPSARLDSELILSFALQKDRTYLHAHSEQIIYSSILKQANLYLRKRISRMPIAYIIGYKEFYGRNFFVTLDVLIPRPESEAIIEILKEILPPTTYQLPTTNLIDVGTGSGCLGITAKLEFPTLNVTVIDISPKALNIATLNAKSLNADITALQSNLLVKITFKPNIIVANLPYVDKSWERSPETDFEPNIALFAEKNGTEIIEKLINQSNKSLNTGGYLIIESDPIQHDNLIEFAKQKSFKLTHHHGYITAFIKIK